MQILTTQTRNSSNLNYGNWKTSRKYSKLQHKNHAFLWTHLGAGTHVKEPTGGVVGAGSEALSVGKQHDRIDVRLVATQGHCALAWACGVGILV